MYFITKPAWLKPTEDPSALSFLFTVCDERGRPGRNLFLLQRPQVKDFFDQINESLKHFPADQKLIIKAEEGVYTVHGIIPEEPRLPLPLRGELHVVPSMSDQRSDQLVDEGVPRVPIIK